MKILTLVSSIITILVFSCSEHGNRNRPASKVEPPHKIYSTDTSRVDTAYIPTGFYFLADSATGIRMRKQFSDEVYTISKTPFVSVNTVMNCSLQKNNPGEGGGASFIMAMDSEGTKNLEEGTGNTSYPYIAIVIANRLLYVVENNSKIKTGKMTIMVYDYSDTEMQEMLQAINQKK